MNKNTLKLILIVVILLVVNVAFSQTPPSRTPPPPPIPIDGGILTLFACAVGIAIKKIGAKK